MLAKRFSDKYNKKQLKTEKMCMKIQQNAYNRTLFDRWIGYSLADLIKFIYKLCL